MGPGPLLLMSNVAPLFTVTTLELEMSAKFARASVPPDTVVAPVYPLKVPSSVSVPAPFWITEPAPVITLPSATALD